MSIRDLFAMSRASGPATVRDFAATDAGGNPTCYERPARNPYQAYRLTDEERLCILTQTGIYPEAQFPAPAYCGLQPGDGYPDSTTKATLAMTGIMRIAAGEHGEPVQVQLRDDEHRAVPGTYRTSVPPVTG